MADTQTAPAVGRFEVRASAADHFAWVRTRLALERTIMSWLRTAVALIGFGFAIVQYLEHLEQTPGARAAFLPHAPRYLGLALISSEFWRFLFRFGSTGGPSVICGTTRSRRSAASPRRGSERRLSPSPFSSSALACSPFLPCC